MPLSWLRHRYQRGRENPLEMLRFALSLVLGGFSLIALVLALPTHSWRLVMLAALLWLFYGIGGWLLGLVDRGLDVLPDVLSNAGVERRDAGYSDVEALLIREQYEAASAALLERARDPAQRIGATLRRAQLLAGAMGQPEAAAMALRDLMSGGLAPADQLTVGLALVDVQEHHLQDLGGAISELGRLLPQVNDLRRHASLKARLARLKAEHLGARDGGLEPS
ncbi:MAG TPA: hypothetical protein VFS74_08985 [Gemmatimonadales bacterium]|jgi:hypothetical protein|nr:hypothetical protein [Gemmatimonadales bacterium]